MKQLVMVALAFLVCASALGQTTVWDQERQREFQQFLEYQKVKGQVEATPAEQVSRFAGVGKEIGVALKEAVQAMDTGLTVTEDHVYRFANTTGGKITIGIIIWKVLGKDIVGIGVGSMLLLLLMIWLAFWIKLLVRGRMVLVKKEGKVKTYQHYDPIKEMNGDVYGWWSAVSAVGAIAMFIGSMVCFFS